MDNTQMFLETELISTFSKDQRMLWNFIKKYQKNQDEQWKWGSDIPSPYIVGVADDVKSEGSGALSGNVKTIVSDKATDVNFNVKHNFVESGKGLYFAGVDDYLNSGITIFKTIEMTTEQKIEVMRMAVNAQHTNNMMVNTTSPQNTIEMYYKMMDALSVQLVDQNTSSNEYYGQEVKKMTTKNTD